jgi:hypothetical protein
MTRGDLRALRGAVLRGRSGKVALDHDERVLDKLTALEKTEGFSDAFIGAVGKLKSYFGRLVGVLHIAGQHSAAVRHVFEIEQELPSSIISRDTAEKAEKLIFEFLLPHTYGLYDVLVGGGKDRDIVRTVADFILTSKKERLVASDFTHGVRPLRTQSHKVHEWAARFVAMGWLLPGDERPIPKSWLVVPGVREHYAERQQKAAKARAIAHAILRAGGTRPRSKQPTL